MASRDLLEKYPDLQPPRDHGRPVADLTGRRFGKLLVKSLAGIHQGHAVFMCDCDCGGAIATKGSLLKKGRTHHCGCSHQNAVHRMGKTPTYSSYMGMLKRCYSPAYERFDRYGGRGITVCDRWRHGEDGKRGFECFLADMGERPSRKHTLDREDNDGNYEPGNCRWATQKEQMRNTCKTVLIPHQGRSMTAAAWAEETNLSAGAIHRRFADGWSPERIFSTPPLEVVQGPSGRFVSREKKNDD